MGKGVLLAGCRGLSLRDMDAYADTKEAYEEEMLQDEETNLYDRIKLSTETEEETVQYK